jgi:hypothetical protein
LPYVNDLIPGSRAWIDNNGAGLWQVVEKQEVFDTSGQLQVRQLNLSSNLPSKNPASSAPCPS